MPFLAMTGQDESREGSDRFAVGLGVVLTSAMAAGIFIQFAVAALAPLLTSEMGLSRADIGGLITSTYVVAILCSPLAGHLVDLVGGRSMLLALFLINALAWAGFGTARSLPWLFAATALAGIPMSLANPATNQLVSLHAPTGRQGLLTGMKQSGAQLGAVFAGLVLPRAATAFGWRIAMLGTALLAALGALSTVLIPPAGHPRRTRPVGRIRETRPLLRWLAPYAFFMGAALAPTFTYLPLYAFEELRFSSVAAGSAMTVMGIVGAAALVVWGRMAGRARSQSRLLAISSAGGALAAACFWTAGFEQPWLVWAGALILGGSAIAWFSVGMLALVREVPRGLTGRSSGFVLLAFYAGFLVSPLAFGFAVDVTRDYQLGWSGVTLLFLLATAVTRIDRGKPLVLVRSLGADERRSGHLDRGAVRETREIRSSTEESPFPPSLPLPFY